MKKRCFALLAALILCCLSPALGEQKLAELPLTEAVAAFTTPFEGTRFVHQVGFEMNSSHYLNAVERAQLADSGSAGAYCWDRYTQTNKYGHEYSLYLVYDASREHMLAYAGATSVNMTAPLETFVQAVRLVDAGFDGNPSTLTDGSLFNSLRALTYDTEREAAEMAQMEAAVAREDFEQMTAYYMGHFVTLQRIRDTGLEDECYWIIYHNTDMNAVQPASAQEDISWTCENGHAGNTGNFCPECGAAKPEKPARPAFCPNCGQSLEGLDANFCPNCGQKL